MKNNISGYKISELSQLFAAWGGWLLDGYTTIAYLLVSIYISKIVFPLYLGYLSLVLTLLPVTFNAISRSFGSFILGNYIGDRSGRKKLLSISILGFSILSASEGLIPSYKESGILSPVILYIILFLDGIFAGAEYGAGSALAMESVPENKREQVGSFMQSGYGTGYFLIVFVEIILMNYLGAKNFEIYGWRILLLTSIIPGLLTMVIRLFSKETDIFKDMEKNGEIEKYPFKYMIKNSKNKILYALMITSGLLFINTATFSFYPVIGDSNFLNLGNSLFYALLIINFISLIGIWSGGIIARNIKNRIKPMIIYSLLFIIPSFIIINYGYTDNIIVFITAFSIQAFFEAMIFSTLPVFLAELFSKKYRSTAIGIVYNGGAIFGGTAMLLLTAPAHIINIKILWIIEIYISGILLLAGLFLMLYIDKSYKNIDPIKI